MANWRLSVSVTCLISALAAAGPAHGQQARNVDQSQASSGEIVVTARKRVETLQSAPVAVTAITAEKLAANGVTSLTDAASLAGGGVVIAQAGVTTTLSIRGVSSDSTNTGFDQTVGLVVDGVFYDRGRWANQGFLDMGQIEILKGPQALYFGRSAVAGAVNITTGNPGPKFEGLLTAGYNIDTKGPYGEAIVSGPISETLGARLAVRGSTSKGPFHNLSASIPSRHFGGVDELSGRLTLVYKPASNFEANLKVALGSLRDDGYAPYSQLFGCKGPDPTSPGPLTGIPGMLGIEAYPVNDDCKLNRNVLVDRAIPGTKIADPFSKLTTEAATLKLALDLPSVSLTSITGLNHYRYDYATGLISSGGLITAGEGESNRAFSEELRLQTKLDGPLNVLLGANYQEARFYHDNINQIFFPPLDPADGRGLSHTHHSTQKGTSWSAFGEATLNLASFELSAGVRYSREAKDSRFVVDYVNPGQFFFFLPQGTVISDNYRDDAWSPQVTAAYKPNRNLTVYASYRTGFLPGGFSHGGTPQPGLTPQDFIFKSEKAKGFEVGVKATLLDGTLRTSMAAYSYDYSNLQVSIYLPALAAFITGNAGSARTRGVEGEMAWQATPEFMLRGYANYNDGKFLDSRGQCYNNQTLAQGCITPPSGVSYQDLSGKPLPRAPRFTATLGGTLRKPIGGLVLTMGADLNYSDGYQLEPTVNPELVQPSFVRIDGNVGLETEDGTWRLSVIGRNLTDRAIMVFGAVRGFTQDDLGVIQSLRQVQVQVSHRF